MSTLIIGAAGAVGKRLVQALTSRGDKIIASDRMPHLPPNIRNIAAVTEPLVDVRDLPSLRSLFEKHKDIQAVLESCSSTFC